MHAVVVTVEIREDFEQARRRLHEEVVPRVSQAPGFVSGYWLAPQDGQGFSVVVFDSEDAATGAADMARSMGGGPVVITDVQVREIVAHA